MSANTVHQGWVEKPGSLWSRASLQWCVLTANPPVLQFYSDEAATVVVGSAVSLEERQISSAPQCFVLVKDRKSIILKFKASSNQEVEAWVKHLHIAVRVTSCQMPLSELEN